MYYHVFRNCNYYGVNYKDHSVYPAATKNIIDEARKSIAGETVTGIRIVLGNEVVYQDNTYVA